MLIYDALKKDHEKVRNLLDQLISLNSDDTQLRHQLVDQIRDELIPHARAEEAVFYNSLRAIDSAKDIVMDGFQEHLEAETKLRMLQVRDKIDAQWKTTARGLKQALEHHIAEEEGKIFNVAMSLFTTEEAQMMGEAFENLKPGIKSEGIMTNTLELVVNMMPPRFAPNFRAVNLNSRI